ncbi:flagellar biosynthetic protein FliO [Stappia sp. ICDLI1TA098]
MTSWLVDTFQMEPGWARGIGFFIAVIIVLALISIFVWVLRRIASTRALGGRSRQPRIAVMDAAALDARRRLVLIRRDNVEHLILVGGPSDVVVEQNIVRGVPVAQAYPRQQNAAFVPPPMETPAVPVEPATAPQAATPAPVQMAPQQPAMQPEAPSARIATPQSAPVRPAAAPQAPAQPRAPVAAPTLRPVTPTQQPQPQPRAPQPAAGEAASAALRRTGASAAAAGSAVAAAGAAVAGLARRATTRADTPATGEAKAPEPARPAPAAEPSWRRDPAPMRRTITPPSSGPAANARTAYPHASNPARDADGAETGAEKPVEPSTEKQDDTTSARGSLAGVSPTSARPSAPAASSFSSLGGASRPAPKPADSAPARPEQATTQAAAEVKPPVASDHALDSSLEDALLAELGSSVEKTEPAPRQPVEEERKAPSVTEPAASQDKPDTPAAAATEASSEKGDDATPDAAKDEAAPARTGQATSMDAIEEEMARLLSEISGPRKS